MRQSTSWSKSSKWYNQIVGPEGHYFHKHLILPTMINLLSLNKSSKVLDVGCGQGVLARSLPEDIEYWGVDISSELISEAINLNKSKHHHFVVSDVTKDMGVPKGNFSHAAIVLALQNIKSVQPVFNQVAELLSPKGVLVIMMNHPCFRIPRQSGWDIDEKNKSQKRWVNSYMTPMDIPILMHPGSQRSESSWSFHYPLSYYVNALNKAGFLIETMEELVSDKESVGRASKMENRSRNEIPLFLSLKAVKRSTLV